MRTLLASVANAAYVLAIQLLALVTLAPAEFGAFSIQYLLFALASSLALSLISESWMRVDVSGSGRAAWREYSSVSVYFATVSGIVTLLVSIMVEPLREIGALGAIAVAAATYRGSARYHAVRVGQRGVLSGDIAGFAVAVSLWLAIYLSGNRDVVAITAVWAASAVVSILFTEAPNVLRPSSLVEWVRQHWPQTRILLGDSLLSNVSSVGTPYALAPVLGLGNFGIYRAVSNVAAPVRLLLTPIAPQLAGKPLSWHRSRRQVAVMVLGSCSFGILAWGALLLIDAVGLELGALTALAQFAIPTGIFVSANFIGHYLSIVARAHLSSRPLIVGRSIHALLGIIFPIAGVVASGLPGAIWGYTASIVVASGMWMALVLRNPATPRT